MMPAPLGYSIGETWADGLILPPGPGRDAAMWLYRSRIIRWVRFMAKLVEYHQAPALYRRLCLDKLREARDAGLRVWLCIDWHNTATSNRDYHQSRWFPPNLSRSVRDIAREVRPDAVEVSNEPAYIQRPHPRLTRAQYRGYVQDYMEGLTAAGFRGPIFAEQTTDHTYPTGRGVALHELGLLANPIETEVLGWDGGWEELDWPGGMVEVRHSWVLDRRSTDPNEFGAQVRQTFIGREPWKGNRWPLAEDEFSSTGRQVHCDTQLGYDMTRAAIRVFRDVRVPFGWLTMGGAEDGWGTPGGSGWGMSTALCNARGEFSMVAKALADDQGVELPDTDVGGKVRVKLAGGMQLTTQRAKAERMLAQLEAGAARVAVGGQMALSRRKRATVARRLRSVLS